MSMRQSIQHRGRVEGVEGDRVFVVVDRETACSGCHAKGVCGTSGTKRVIEVQAPRAAEFSVGESVVVALLHRAMGVASVVLGYVVPLILLVSLLIGAKALGAEDGVAAMITLAGIALYYVLLYLLRRRIERNIEFTIIKE